MKGTVTDIFGSVIVGATLHFVEGRHNYETRTAEDGTYSIDLPPGRYAVSAKGLGFCKVGRSSIVLEKGMHPKLDFELMVCGFHSNENPYAEEQFPSINASGIQPLLQFGSRKDRGAVEYTGFVEQGKYVRPVFTYNLWTLRANSIIYDRTMRTITGEGDVIWQNGMTSKSAKHIEIVLLSPLKVVKIE